jgi:hypothetical protein
LLEQIVPKQSKEEKIAAGSERGWSIRFENGKKVPLPGTLRLGGFAIFGVV